MRLATLLLCGTALTTGCGRLGFDAATDASARTDDGDIGTRGSNAIDAPGAVRDALTTGDGAPAATPITLVQAIGAQTASAATLTATFATPVVPGHVVIATVSTYGTPALSALHDTAGNTYTDASGPIPLDENGTMFGMTIAYTVAGATGKLTGVTATFSGACRAELRIFEFANLATTAPLVDTTGLAVMTQTPPVTASGPQVTTKTANELVFGFELATTATAGTGFQTALTLDGVATEYLIEDAPTTVRVTGDITSGPFWAIMAATFHGL